LPHRQARARRRRRADPRQLAQHPATTPRPRRQPADQRRPSPRHRHPRPLLPRDPGWSGPDFLDTLGLALLAVLVVDFDVGHSLELGG
jgi:hypothetical protein